MLVCERLSAGYGNVPVVRDLTLEVAAGELLVIGGENGAGKSTLLRTLAGFIRPSTGRVTLDGVDITLLRTDERVRRGVRLVLDGHRVFPEMSVEDNLRLGYLGRGAAGMKDLRDEVYATYPVLHDKRRLWARDLSGGQQQMLALGQALMAQPKVIMCDEPSLGLAQSLMPQVMQSLKKLATCGAAVIVVEQTIDLALPVADRVIMIQRGAIHLQSSSAELEAARGSKPRGRDRLRALGPRP